MMEALGRPHEAFESVHVAGTNGKGSTASLLAAISAASGRRTGLHTSPHLLRINERLRLNGEPAPDSWLAHAVGRCKPLFDDLRPTFFEATTALAFLYFAECQVDLAIIEVGLGGRLDATNVLVPTLSIITSISLDHTDLLGRSIEEIAREKGGIIKPGVPVLAGTEDRASNVIRRLAAEWNAPFYEHQCTLAIRSSTLVGLILTVHSPTRIYRDLVVGLAGAHQAANTLLAIRAAELLSVALQPGPVYDGLRHVVALSGLRGRLETLQHNPLVVVDVAQPVKSHRRIESGFACCAPDGSSCFSPQWWIQDVQQMAAILAAAGAHVFACGLDSPRAWKAPALGAVLRRQDATVLSTGSVTVGWRFVLDTARNSDAILVAGSHQLAAAVIGHATPR